MPFLTRPRGRIIMPSQEVLLQCGAVTCEEDANPACSVITGVLGLGRVRVYFCSKHYLAQQKGKADMARKSHQGKEKITSD